MKMYSNENIHGPCANSVFIDLNRYSGPSKIPSWVGTEKVHQQGRGKTWKYVRKYAKTVSAKANSQRGNKQHAKEDLLILQRKNMIMENALHMRS